MINSPIYWDKSTFPTILSTPAAIDELWFYINCCEPEYDCILAMYNERRQVLDQSSTETCVTYNDLRAWLDSYCTCFVDHDLVDNANIVSNFTRERWLEVADIDDNSWKQGDLKKGLEALKWTMNTLASTDSFEYKSNPYFYRTLCSDAYSDAAASWGSASWATPSSWGLDYYFYASRGCSSISGATGFRGSREHNIYTRVSTYDTSCSSSGDFISSIDVPVVVTTYADTRVVVDRTVQGAGVPFVELAAVSGGAILFGEAAEVVLKTVPYVELTPVYAITATSWPVSEAGIGCSGDPDAACSATSVENRLTVNYIVMKWSFTRC